MTSAGVEQIADMDARVSGLQAHCETCKPQFAHNLCPLRLLNAWFISVEEARSAQRTETLADFDGIIEETQETYKDLQIDMKECSDDLEAGLDELASTVREIWVAAEKIRTLTGFHRNRL